MKKLILSIIYLTFSIQAWSDGSDCYQEITCPSRYCSQCQCTDLGRNRHDCISDKRYCQAFGNIGDR